MYKKRDERAKLLLLFFFCQSRPIAFKPFSLTSPSSLLKLSIDSTQLPWPCTGIRVWHQVWPEKTAEISRRHHWFAREMTRSRQQTQQTLCDKRDNNFVWNKFSPDFTLLQTDLFYERPEKISVKWRSRQNTQVMALSRLCHTSFLPSSSYCRPVA